MKPATVLENLRLKVGDVVLFDSAPKSDFLVIESRGDCARSLWMRVFVFQTGNLVDLQSCVVDAGYEILRAAP